MQQARDDDHRFRTDTVACLDSLYRFARSLAHRRDIAEDLVQETYLRALRAGRRPQDTSGVRPWLFTILHNVWRNERRRPRVESLDAQPLLGRHLSSASSRDEELDREAVDRRLALILEEMPDPYRSVVLLRFGESFSYQEIAQILQCPAGTVMSRLSRARAMIVAAMAAPSALRTPANVRALGSADDRTGRRRPS